MEKEIYAPIDAVMTGQVLHNKIRKKGYTVSEIQSKLNLSCPQSIYRWLKGKTLPSVDNLYTLSMILKVHMEELLVPRHDRAWILRGAENCDRSSRLKACKAYLKVVGAHG